MTSGGLADVIAGVAVLVAAIALIYTIRSTTAAGRSASASERSAHAAERAAVATEIQAETQRQIQIAAAQPYIWADVRQDESQGVVLDLVMGNSGQTVATNVRARIDPPLPTHPQMEEAARAQQQVAAEGISALAPGAMVSWHLGPGFHLIPSEGQQRHEITITADGPFGPIPQLTYVVDLADFRGQPVRAEGNLQQLTKAVEKLANKIKLATCAWWSRTPPSRGRGEDIYVDSGPFGREDFPF